jgi:hypothetical protein
LKDTKKKQDTKDFSLNLLYVVAQKCEKVFQAYIKEKPETICETHHEIVETM